MIYLSKRRKGKHEKANRRIYFVLNNRIYWNMAIFLLCMVKKC
ncbi:hypothetical protein [Staphylococcus phage PT94]